MTFVFDFLRAHWASSLLAAAMLSIAALLSIQHVQITHCRSLSMQYKAQIAALENANNELIISLQHQNTAVMALKAQSSMKEEHAAKALLEAQKRFRARLSYSRKIQSEPQTKSECEAVQAMINHFDGGQP